MGATIAVRVLRALMMHGQNVEARTLLELDVLAAADAVGSGRAKFAVPADAPRVQAAIAEDRDRLLGKLGAVERHRAAASWLLRVA